ncbi:MAG: NUDIX hydrolase, partial [Bacilli bacterium]|nr:NUDIX hydrolase [Bacilli bacterium]
MNEITTRYCTTFILLDRIDFCFNTSGWNKSNIKDIIEEYDKHYGFHLISQNSELHIRVEYTNIIWDYKIFYASCKKRYKPLDESDERWVKIEKLIQDDLNRMGLKELLETVITHLKNREYYEYKEVTDMQFKRYCIKEDDESMKNVELIEIVDEEGKPTGRILPREKIHNRNYLHNEVACFVINDNKEILLEKRSPNKRYSPNKYGLCAGHVIYGENLKSALIREIDEEIGIKVNENDLIPFGEKEYTREETNSHITYFYYTKLNLDISSFT